MFYPVGSHHFALFYLTDAAVSRGLLDIGVVPEVGVAPSENFRVFELAHIGLLGVVGTERIFIVGTQRDKTNFQFPEGVALRIPGNTVYDLNSHYINLLGTDTMQGEVYVNIHTIPPEDVKYEAKVLLVYNNDINVPPGTTRTTGYDWLIKDELKRVGVSPDADMHVVVLSSHMHRHGELFEITRLSTKELLHRSISYDSAPVTVFDPPLILDGDDGLGFACTQSNYDKDAPIRFGFTSEDEMCVMYGYYYLSTEGTETGTEE